MKHRVLNIDSPEHLRMHFCLFIITVVVSVVTDQKLETSAADVCSAYMYPASDKENIRIAAVLGMHDSADGICTTYNTGALQNALALKWAAELLNGDNETGSFIPGVKIGIEIYDDCNTEYLAARHSGTLASQARIGMDCSTDMAAKSSDIPLAGVIGTSFSHTTTVIAKFLEPTFIPVIGHSATVMELSNKSKYPHFVRVVPSDLKQIKMIIQLAKHLSWSYIVGISTSDNYGKDGMAELRRLASEEMICVIHVPDFDTFEEPEMLKLVRTTLTSKTKVTKTKLGLIYFGLEFPLIRFLKFMEEHRSTWEQSVIDALKKLYWVTSDAVVASQELAQFIAQYRTNILVMSPFIVNISSFKRYFYDTLKNPPTWISGQWKMAIYNVVTKNLRCSNYNFTEESMRSCRIDDFLVFDNYNPSAVDALYLLVNTLKSFHTDACKESSGLCSAFKTNLNNGMLKTKGFLDLDYSSINVTYVPSEFFKAQRKLVNTSGDFEVINQPFFSLQGIKNNNFAEAAKCEGDSIKMSSDFKDIFSVSECAATCEECWNIRELSYTFHPGDVIILGFFSLRWPSVQNPYGCGAYREKSKSYIAMQAFINAVNHLNNSTGVNFGYLIIDDCYNMLTLTKMLIGIISGDITVKNQDDSVTFNSSKVAVAIGAQSSDVTMAALPILTELNITLISYSATTAHLDNRIMYPYFFRTVGSDTSQARAFVEIIKAFQVTYIGVVVVQNSYGLELYRLFRSIAESQNICVDDAVKVSETFSAEMFLTILSDYRSKEIQVILIIAMDKIVSNFLNAVKQDDTFVFIGSEAWGPNFDIISHENGKKARGALVLGASSVQVDFGLKDHLQTLDPFTHVNSVWLTDFWQDQFKCDMPGGFVNTFKDKPCDNGTFSSLNTIIDSLANFPLALHAQLATRSAGQTVSNLIKKRKQMPFNVNEFTDELHRFQLEDKNIFSNSGNGNFGFDIYNVQTNADSKDGFMYLKVGSYKNETGLVLNKEMVKFYDATGHVVDKVESSCMFQSKCILVCNGSSTSISPVTSTSGSSNQQQGVSQATSSTIVILAVLLAIFVLIIVIFIILEILWYTGKVQLKWRSPKTDNMPVIYQPISPAVSEFRGRDNSYSSPHDSSSGDSRPELPSRNTSDKNYVYTNKAFSDIASKHYIKPTENVDTRERADSLPTLSISSTTKNQQPGLQAHSSQSLQETKHITPAQLGLALAFSPGHDNKSTVDQNAEDDSLYQGWYRNAAVDTNGSPKHLQNAIIFHNVPFDSAVYTIASSSSNTNNYVFSGGIQPQTEYVLMKTEDGILPIPTKDFHTLLQNSGLLYTGQPHFVNNISTQCLEEDTSETGIGNSPFHQNNEVPVFKDYITPIDVTYDTKTRTNSPTRINPVFQSSAKVDSPSEMISGVVVDKFYPKSHVDNTCKVDSSNYLLSSYNTGSHKVAGKGVETFSGGHNVQRPQTLPVIPVYSPSNLQPQTLLLHGRTNNSHEVHTGHVSDSASAETTQNKMTANELQMNKVPVSPETQTEGIRRQRGQISPSRVVLSHLAEEPEEIV